MYYPANKVFGKFGNIETGEGGRVRSNKEF